MHICIRETCKVYSVSQEHHQYTGECASIYLHGSFINRRANYYGRKNTNPQFRIQNYGTIAISDHQFEHEMSTNRITYQLPWKILKVRPHVIKPLRCYRCQRFGHLAVACSAKKERCNMLNGHHHTQQCLAKTQNSESVDLKCANCGENTFCKQQSLQCSSEKMQQK